ncbi:enoyl-CoA hydratase domain-containing protein 2, mitochondrial [Pseudoliparis swirei]|uniref:enoyl-CoA hydratase domain-containing protein 2, mitochondrial n=1 Tax=Pseudoliparis swirei TaxID=2059687 RepID=UPI0024BE260E|nr:enoyl-CoA hydratase domain-containing protein 2, mitochondrial [Pseudoliparis swirei]
MATLLRRLTALRCSSRPGTGAILRAARGRPSAPVPRDAPPPLAGHGRALTAGLHTTAAEPVQVDVKRLEGEDDGIVEVLLCRHKARNALGYVFVSQLRNLVSALSRDSVTKVVVFRSLVPGVFCAGADLKERVGMNPAESDLFVHGLRTLMTEIASLPMPTIAAMDGAALGGGLELAMACDLRTAAYSAQMGLIETTRGLLPGAGGSQRLPRAVGLAMAKELIFTGKRLGGQAALDIGLVNRAVEQNQNGDAAHGEALSLAREILPQAPVAVRLAKEAMNRGIELDINAAMGVERMCYVRVINTRDRKEGMAAFLEKRPPRFTGE